MPIGTDLELGIDIEEVEIECGEIKTFENGTHVNCNLTGILLEPYQIQYLELSYPISDVFKTYYEARYLDSSWITNATNPTYVIKLPKYAPTIFGVDLGLTQLSLKKLHPYPDWISDEGNYLVLAWTEPSSILDNGLKNLLLQLFLHMNLLGLRCFIQYQL